jgi:hypothetical protein
VAPHDEFIWRPELNLRYRAHRFVSLYEIANDKANGAAFTGFALVGTILEVVVKFMLENGRAAAVVDLLRRSVTPDQNADPTSAGRLITMPAVTYGIVITSTQVIGSAAARTSRQQTVSPAAQMVRTTEAGFMESLIPK